MASSSVVERVTEALRARMPFDGEVTRLLQRTYNVAGAAEGTSSSSSKREDGTKGRHVSWRPGGTYRLVRAGEPVRDEQHIQALKDTGQVDERYFYYFRHADADAPRSASTPVWEVVYFCQSRNAYVRVQKCHLHKAYERCGRKDDTRAYEMMMEGLPYWVDRYLFCRLNQVEARERYKRQKTAARGGVEEDV